MLNRNRQFIFKDRTGFLRGSDAAMPGRCYEPSSYLKSPVVFLRGAK
jgi:hypothetical protein